MSDEKEPSIADLVDAINVVNDRHMALESIMLAPLGKQPEGQPPSVSVRLDALEKAVQFAMSNIKVQITSQSPIIGGGAHTQQMTMLELFMQTLKQNQMLVNSNG